jgi:hypothetical protein
MAARILMMKQEYQEASDTLLVGVQALSAER